MLIHPVIFYLSTNAYWEFTIIVSLFIPEIPTCL